MMSIPLSKIQQKKRISCKRCQDRKIKCSKSSPCQRCAAVGVRCEFRGDGLKRAPISREYVTALETRIGAWESFLSDLKASPSWERETMINTIEFGGHLSAASGPSGIDSSFESRSSTSFGNETILDHRPRGLCSSKLLKSTNQSYTITPPLSPLCINIKTASHNRVVAECLALFFRWQHPHCLLIERDNFLLDYENKASAKNYISQALESSICALGALMSDSPDIRGLADGFAALAIQILESGNLLDPQENSIQALILCSFYQIGKGNFTKSWMLSGIAFRMSQDLERVEHHNGTSTNTAVRRDISKNRRRMFRNCYESDKMISLLLGKAVTVQENFLYRDRNEKETNSTFWEDWLQKNDLVHLREPELLLDICLVLKKREELCSIINDILLHTHSPKRVSTTRPVTQQWDQMVVNELNARFWRWHDNLPGDLRWNPWGSNLEVVYPSVAALHMLYHTAHISLNLPYLTSENIKSHSTKLINDALMICKTSVDVILSILRRFKSQYSLKNAPLSFVQGAIIATDATLAMTDFHNIENPLAQDKNLRALDDALLDLSHSWDIASSARNGLQNLLAEIRKEKQQVVMSDPSLTSSPNSILPGFEYAYAPSYGEGEYGFSTPEAHDQNVFSFGDFGMADPLAWDVDLMTGELVGSENAGMGTCFGDDGATFGFELDDSTVNCL